jgi:hypothetical protein
MQILAATDFSTRSNRALRQAGLLAQPGTRNSMSSMLWMTIIQKN